MIFQLYRLRPFYDFRADLLSANEEVVETRMYITCRGVGLRAPSEGCSKQKRIYLDRTRSCEADAAHGLYLPPVRIELGITVLLARAGVEFYFEHQADPLADGHFKARHVLVTTTRFSILVIQIDTRRTAFLPVDSCGPAS